MLTLLHLATLTAAVLILTRVLPGFRIRSPVTAVAVAVVFSLINWSIGWLIRWMLFLPAILTLGLLFLILPFIVNAIVLWLTDLVVASFEIEDSRTLWLAAGAITLVNFLFHVVTRAQYAHGWGPNPVYHI